MTQTQFFAAVAHISQLSKAQVKLVFQSAEAVVKNDLKAAGKIPLGSLGTVKLVERKARKGRNPATGQAIDIPAKTAVKIAPAKVLKDTFNKAPEKAPAKKGAKAAAKKK